MIVTIEDDDVGIGPLQCLGGCQTAKPGADDDSAYLVHNVTGDAIVCEGVETVILAYGATPDTELEDSLAGSSIPTHLAGDCVSPRTAEEAVLEGMRVGLAV